MRKGDKPMNDNVVPIRKADKFGVYLGEITDQGEVIEGESVGIAFLRPGRNVFRLKLWTFASEQYFVAPDENDSAKYTVLSLHEHQLASGKIRSHWNKIGRGVLVGRFIKLQLPLLGPDLFLYLFPGTPEPKEDMIAS